MCCCYTQRWCSSRRLQLNPSKTELIRFGTRCSLQKIAASDRSLQIDEDIIIGDKPVVRDLGVLLDSELTMKRHINQVAINCFYHIRRVKRIRRLLGSKVMVKVVTSLIISRLDYCNSVVVGLPISTSAFRTQRHDSSLSSVHVITRLPRRDLHWLPVEYRITYKLSLLVHRIHNGKAPPYLSDIVTATSGIESRSGLRLASSDRYEIPRSRLPI